MTVEGERVFIARVAAWLNGLLMHSFTRPVVAESVRVHTALRLLFLILRLISCR